VAVRIITGDCREVLPTLDAGSVQCVVTSPPYYGLRDYGTADWVDGDTTCDHAPDRNPRGTRQRSGLTGSLAYNDARDMPYRDTCGKCGAIRVDKQIGLEGSVAAYVAEIVAVFREVRQVLADDGVLWLNLGDSYVSQGGERTYSSSDNAVGRGDAPGFRPGSGRADGIVDDRGQRNRNGITENGMRPKNLIGVPWRVAFALQDDGWILRQDIIWHKPNPMPESVTDRCTKAHEYLFLFAKQPRYYYDAEAIAESADPASAKRYAAGYKNYANGQFEGSPTDRRSAITKGAEYFEHLGDRRNKRSVWTVATMPYADAHFATFPEKLIEPCILAGSREGDTILDPFGGSGTTGKVAERFGRHSILIELNPAYTAMIETRTAQRGLALGVD
jgi:DNA modification methylase